MRPEARARNGIFFLSEHENGVLDVETAYCDSIERGDPSSVGMMACGWRRAAVIVPTPFESNVSTSMGQTVMHMPQ